MCSTMKWIGVILCLLLAGQMAAQKEHRLLRQGDKNYEQENLGAAESAYRKALEAKESAKGIYNLGNTVYQQGRYDEAVKHFEKAATSSSDPHMRANAFHNLGNSYFKQGEYAKSVEAYKNALRLNPNDYETKTNLIQALRNVPPPKPEEQQSEGDSNEDKENDEQNPQQKPQQEDDQNAGNEQDQPQPEDQDSNQDQQSSQGGQQNAANERDLSREEAERLLQIMENEEQKTMEKLRQARSRTCSSDKDW